MACLIQRIVQLELLREGTLELLLVAGDLLIDHECVGP